MTAHAAIHIGCKQLGIGEEDRRDLYERVTNKRSLTEMSPAEHEAVVAELKRLGFRKTKPKSKKKLQGKYAPKLQALWIAAWNLGLIRNKSDQAMLAFVKRQTGVDHTRFLRHAEDADKAIEALKGWMNRDAFVDWSVNKFTPDYQRLPGYKIAAAQWFMIKTRDCNDGFYDQIFAVQTGDNRNLEDPQFWIMVMNVFGERVRALKK